MNAERLLAESLTVEPAPPGLWDQLQKRRRARLLKYPACAGAILIVAALLYPRQAAVVDLGEYLGPVRAARPEASSEALGSPVKGFAPVAGSADKGVAGLRLVREYRRGSIDQAIFDRSDGLRLALFSAPANMRFRYGEQAGVETMIEGIRCEKVDCPKQETYSFVAHGKRYVIVSKSCTPSDAAAIMLALGAPARARSGS